MRDFLAGAEVQAPIDTTASVKLGDFHVPLGAKPDDVQEEGSSDDAEPSQHNGKRKVVWMELKFTMSAETAPESAEALAAAAKANDGPLGDAVLTIVRSSSSDELADPRLTAVKSRLTEAVRGIVGAGLVRQLVLNDVASEAL